MSSESASHDAPESKPKKRNWVGWIIMLAIIGAGAIYGFHHYQASLTREVTDNAQVSANISQVSPRIRGQIAEVSVADNQLVKKGDLLFRLDPTDYQTRVEQAESQLAVATNALRQAELKVTLLQATSQANVDQTGSSVSASEKQVSSAGQSVNEAQARVDQTDSQISGALAGVAQARAQLEVAQAEAKRLADDRARYEQLFSKREVSAQQMEAARTASIQADARVEAASFAVRAAQAQVENAQAAKRVALEAVDKARAVQGEMRARVGEAEGRLRQAEAGRLEVAVAREAVKGAQANLQTAQTNLKAARQDLEYCKVYAPIDGRVTHKNIEVGQFVQSGSPALALVDEAGMWVVANFKETQMEKIHPGLRVSVKVDTYPDHELDGRVESIQAGTGAVFSLLPPENASGNFVKVVQRIPVKITLLPEEQKRASLRPGMSVEATVWLQ